MKKFWYYVIIGTALALLLGFAVGYADCLTEEQVMVIDSIASATNTSSPALLSIFEMFCSVTDELGSDVLSLNVTLDKLNASLASNMTFINNTLYNMVNSTNASQQAENLLMEARMNTSWFNTINDKVNATYLQQAQVLMGNFTGYMDTYMRNYTVRYQGMLETDVDSIWDKVATKEDLNLSVARMEQDNLFYYKQVDSRFSNVLFIIGGIVAVGAVVFVYYSKYRPKYFNIKTPFRLKSEQILPQKLDEDDEMAKKDEIKKMKEYILSLEKYSGKVRSDVLKKYLANEITSKEEIDTELKLLEEMPKAKAKKGKKHG